MRSIYISLNSLLKEIASCFIRYSGISLCIRNFYARRKVSIAVYHDPKPDILERHLKYLSKRYNFISLQRLVNAIYSKNWTDIPERSLIITLDDGHKGNFDLLEVFKKYCIVPTIYLCSQIVNTNRHFWFKVDDINVNELKKYTDHERRRNLEEKFGFTPMKEYPEEARHTLNKKELMVMKNYFDFQAHSLSHPLLTACTDEECKKEIFQAKSEIEALLGSKCEHFSYPNGDYTEREVAFVKRAGYLSARTVDVGWNDCNTDPYRLKVRMITDDASINLLDAQLTGITQYLRYVIRGSVTGKLPTTLPKRVPE